MQSRDSVDEGSKQVSWGRIDAKQGSGVGVYGLRLGYYTSGKTMLSRSLITPVFMARSEPVVPASEGEALTSTSQGLRLASMSTSYLVQEVVRVCEGLIGATPCHTA